MRHLAVAASNIANVDTTSTLPGSTAAYTPLSAQQMTGPGGAPTVQVTPVRQSFVPQSDPSASFADKNGMVAAPNVDPVKELISMLEAQQSVVANTKPEQTVSEIFQSLYGMHI
jgi:flagellar basal-body rod protein FlgC